MARNKPVGNARGRVLFSVMLAFAVIAVVFFGGLYALRTRQMNLTMDETAFTVAALEKKSLETGATLMSAVAARIKHEDRLADAMVKRNDREMLRFGDESFDRLHDRTGLARLAFLAPDRKPVRVFGLPVKPATEIAPFGAVFPSGLEVRLFLDEAGYLLLDVISPWVIDGRTVGFVELAQDATKAFDTIHQSTNSDIVFLARKDLMDKDAWEPAERARGRDTNWDLFSGTLAVTQTLKSIPTSLGLLLEEAGQPRRVVIGGEGGRRVLNLAWLGVEDTQGNQIGNVVVLRDVTKASESFRQTVLVTAALGLLSAILLFILLTAVFDDAEKRERKRAVAERLSGSGAGLESVDLRELTMQTGRQLEREISGLKMDLRLPEQPCLLSGDRLLLRDALHQLVLNAIEAAPDLPISLSVAAEPRESADGWSIVVADEGMALASTDKGVVAALTARLGARHASGVTIVDRIASLAGGIIEARNRAGGGVETILWLPSVPTAKETAPQSS